MRAGRNDPCPCGSGKKYKQCHGRSPAESPAAKTPTMVRKVLSTGSKPVNVRECDGCTACCGPSLQINCSKLVKPTGETCPHVCETGCTIWETEAFPALCRTYTCNYLVEPLSLTLAERPDRVGVIVQRRETQGTRLLECKPGGLVRVLQNRFWGTIIREDMRAGCPLIVKFLKDPHGAETLRVRLSDGNLKCELAVCDEQGEPILARVEPVHDRPIFAARFCEGLDFPFDADALAVYLGTRDSAVLAPSSDNRNGPRLCFRVTRKQIAFLRRVRQLLGSGMLAAR